MATQVHLHIHLSADDVELPERLLLLLRDSGVVTVPRPASGRRGARVFHEGTPEWEGNYARLYKENLRPDLWEMIYRAATAFDREPFTIEQLAGELGVDVDDVRKRMRALGRSRIVADILQALGGEGFEGNTREDALPWTRDKVHGRWAYRFWTNQDEISAAEWIAQEGA